MWACMFTYVYVCVHICVFCVKLENSQTSCRVRDIRTIAASGDGAGTDWEDK